nr:PREDICTED: vacuolar protein sorting-associated protein 37A [Latimeria chalumnae]|eukprot:XP_014346297.1 PREDICTED: vacuolar protein sorting-associated protein 37A [Latimeria chalumnae]
MVSSKTFRTCINHLFVFNSIAEIQKDVEYRLPFTVNNTTININILLPPQFPQEKPVVSVFPPVRHHLVDQHNGTVVTSPLLTNVGTFFFLTVFLCMVINGMLVGWFLFPLCSISQLKDLNDQDNLLLEQLVDLPQLKQVMTDRDDLVKSIEKLASNPQSCSLSTMQARLKVAAHQAEEESDTIADEFLEGKVEIDDFLSSFMEKRTMSKIVWDYPYVAQQNRKSTPVSLF